jgi:thiamine transport system permease protein
VAFWRPTRALLAVISVIPVFFIAFFLLYPLGRVLWLGLRPIAQGGFASLAEIARDTGLGSLLATSLAQALISTGLTLAVGLPAAYVFGNFDFPGKTALRTLLSIPFVLPTVVAASAFVTLIGSGGVLEKIVRHLTGNGEARIDLVRTLPAVLIAHVFFNVSIVVRIVGGAWTNLDRRIGDAGRVLGAGRWALFFRVTLRLLLPSIIASAILVLAYCFASFGVVLILGGPRVGTLETEIYSQAMRMFNLPGAAFLSALQLAITGLVMYAYARAQRSMNVVLNTKPASVTLRKPVTSAEKAAVLAFGVLPTMGLILPLFALALGSFLTRSGPGFAYWAALFNSTGHSIFWSSPLLAARNSLFFSAVAVLLSLLLGVPAAYLVAGRDGSPAGARKGGAGALDLLFLLPLGTSAAALGFGFIASLGIHGFDLRGSFVLIPIAHALVALPLVVRSLLGPLRSISSRLRESAALLGAGPARVRIFVDLPILRRAFIAAAAFAFTVSLGEFAATSLLTRPELTTIPFLIYDFLSRPGELNHGQALAMSTLLMAVCCAGLAGIERFRLGGTEIF